MSFHLIRILFSLILIFTFLVDSKGQSSFSERLTEIDAELEKLADSIAPGLNEEVRFDISDAPIQEFLGVIAATHELNISVPSGLNILVTNRFTNARVRDILLFVCRTYKLDIQFVNNILYVAPYDEPKEAIKPYQEKALDISYDEANDLLSFNLKNDSISFFAQQVTEKTGKNVIVNNEINKVRVSGFINAVKFENALEKMALVNNLTLTKTQDGFYILDPPVSTSSGSSRSQPRTSRNSGNQQTGGNLVIETETIGVDTYINLTAYQSDIVEVVQQISEQLGIDYFFFSLPEGTITTNITGVTYDRFISTILKPTNHTYKVVDDIYLIGKREIEGLRSSEIFKLKFRSVDEIDQFIPPEMKEGVQISIFKELNALILSGSSPQIEEIKAFLQEIDEPVPNILIEVMVVDIRKGYSLQSGIQALLGDSTAAPQSSGSVFPGVDVTVGTDAINGVLGSLNKSNLINLGKVTPRFYLTLKALEDNNNISIRSTPKLATLNGHEAILTIGQSVYFVQRTQNVNPGVNPITTISEQYKQVEANLSLLISPLVSGNEHITLSIEAEFSTFIPPEIENAPPGNATRKFNSMIRVQNEEMIVLGGLEEVSKSSTSTGTPLLSRIPVLKWLFSSRSKEKGEDRLMVFLKPTIVF